jgi:hypothetical protein
VLSDSTSTYELQVLYGDGSIQSATTLARALSKAKDSILLSPQP